MTCSWKDNWETTKEYFIGWWQRDDLVLCGTPLRFDPESTWWKIQEATLSACAALA